MDSQDRQNLPDEVLLHILTFIPKNILRNMHAVSKLFYEVAMPIRYGEVSFKISDFAHARRVESMKMLSDQTVARFVRKLTVTIDKPVLQRAHPNSNPTEQDSCFEATVAWPYIWMRLLSVTHLNLVLNTWPGTLPLYIHPLFTHLWAILGPRIQHLELDSAFEKIQPVLAHVPLLSALPLRSVKIGWRAKYGKLKQAEVSNRYALLGALVSRAQQTIESIDLQPMCLIHDFGHVFGYIFPQPEFHPYRRLRHLSLTTTKGKTPLQPRAQVDNGNHDGPLIVQEGMSHLHSLGQFITAHSAQLGSLHLDLPHEWYTRSGTVEKASSCQAWQVPELAATMRSLITNHFPDFDSCLSSLRLCARTLQALSITNLSIKIHELKHLLKLLRGTACLEVLNIHLNELTAESLLLSASSLPKLSILQFGIEKVQVKPFITKLEAMSNNPDFQNWSLEIMDITAAPNESLDIADSNLGLWIGRCCPNLKRFNKKDLPRVDENGNYITGTACGGLINYGYLALSPSIPRTSR